MEIWRQERNICMFAYVWKCSLPKTLQLIFLAMAGIVRTVAWIQYLREMMTNRLNRVFCLEGMLKLLDGVPAVPLNNAVLMIQIMEVVL